MLNLRKKHKEKNNEPQHSSQAASKLIILEFGKRKIRFIHSYIQILAFFPQ